LENSILQNLYAGHPVIKALLALLKEKETEIYLKGLAGSAVSMVCSSVFVQSKQNHLLCILNDLEEAGYFYHDCCQVLGEEDVLFFPSQFKRNIRYGQKDPGNEILRTEVLSRLNTTARPCLIVSYPEALAEKVVSGSDLKNSTLSVNLREKIDSLFVADVLESYGFERVDYVYEPGQYAVRGSIMDVFSFSNEYPYRIDFFGDEVESIRVFDVETQLSKESLDTISIISAQPGDVDTTLFAYLPETTFLVFRKEEWLYEKCKSLWNEEPVLANEETFSSLEQIRLLLTPEEVIRELTGKYKKIHLSPPPHPHKEGGEVPFSTEPQLSYHKNFELVASSFKEKLAEGYTLYVLSNNEKQIKRIESIFEDRGDNIRFTPVLHTIHEGFIDKTLRI
jgi:transcription-repair coupling factor (superfamily II helicase)